MIGIHFSKNQVIDISNKNSVQKFSGCSWIIQFKWIDYTALNLYRSMNMFNNTNKLFLALKLSEYILEALRKILYFLFFQMLMLAIQPKDKKYTLYVCY